MSWVDTHNVGVEDHEEGGLQNEGEVISEVTEHVAKLVFETKRTNITFDGCWRISAESAGHENLQCELEVDLKLDQFEQLYW